MDLQGLLKLLGFTGAGAGTVAVVVVVIGYLKCKDHERRLDCHDNGIEELDGRIDNVENKTNSQEVTLAKIEERTDTLVKGQDRIFEILNIVFSVERWTLKSFKRFMSSVKNSELLNPLYDGIFDLHENCKNYMKTM